MGVFTALTLEEICLQIIREREEYTALDNKYMSHIITDQHDTIQTASLEVTLPSGQVTRLILAALTDAARAMEATASLAIMIVNVDDTQKSLDSMSEEY